MKYLLLLSLLCTSCFCFGQEQEEAPIYMATQESPRFPGCEDLEGPILDIKKCADKKMIDYVYSNLKYPKTAIDNGIEGTAVISFVIEKDGSITNEKIFRQLAGGCGEEALRIVKSFPDFISAKQNGEIVRFQYILPVKFSLSKVTNDVIKTPPPILPERKEKEEEGVEQESVFRIVEEMPRYPGCENMKGNIAEKKKCADEKMMDFLYSNLKYPEQAKANGTQGTTVISFIIEEDGRVTSHKILKKVKDGCSEEALRLVKMFPRWIPGKQQKRPVRVQFTIPISFALPKEEKPMPAPAPKEEKISNEKMEIFSVVEEMPRFPGCEDISGDEQQKKQCANRKMLEYLYSKIKYPQEARANGTQGLVVIRFVVEKDGSIQEIDILRDPGDGCGEEAKRIIQTFPRWIPGKMRGKPVRVYYNLPVRFKL